MTIRIPTFSIFFFVVVSTFGQVTGIKIECHGIPISNHEFNKSLKKMNKLYKSMAMLNVDDIVLGTRIYNTLGQMSVINFLNAKHSRRLKKKRYKYFNKAWGKNIFESVLKLDAKTSTGMGFHSEKYNLDLGGAKINENSIFCVK